MKFELGDVGVLYEVGSGGWGVGYAPVTVSYISRENIEVFECCCNDVCG